MKVSYPFEYPCVVPTSFGGTYDLSDIATKVRLINTLHTVANLATGG